jgi:hypothetical protein
VAVPETATVEGRSGQHGAGRRFAATAAELHAVLAGDASDVLLGSKTGVSLKRGKREEGRERRERGGC